MTYLNDCIAVGADGLAVDPTLTVPGVTFDDGFASQLQADGVSTLVVPTLEAEWDLPTSLYVTGIQFKYVPTAGGPEIVTDAQPIAGLFWSTADRIITGKEYACYWRAVGLGAVGLWSTPAVNVTINTAFDLAGADGVLDSGDLYTFLWTIEANLWRFDHWVPANGAYSEGVPPAAAFTGFGEQTMAWHMPGANNLVELRLSGIKDLISADTNARYSFGFMAKTSDVAGSTIRFAAVLAGTRTPVTGLAPQVYALTTVAAQFKWEDVFSDDPAWIDADLLIYVDPGDLGAAKEILVSNLQGQYNFRTLTLPWRPSPDEDGLMRWAELIQELFDAKRAASPGEDLVVTANGDAHKYTPPGPRSLHEPAGATFVLKQSNAGGYIRPGSNSDVIVPENAVTPIKVLTAFYIGGPATLVPGSGVTVNGGSLKIEDGETGWLVKVDTDEWDLRRMSGAPVHAIPYEIGDETTALAVGVQKKTFRLPYPFTVIDTRGNLRTAQAAGAVFTVDINASGVSILSTKLTIDNGEKTSKTAAAPPVFSRTSLDDDEEITVDFDQVDGATTAAGYKGWLIGYQTSAAVVGVPLIITGAPDPDAEVGLAYTFAVAASGGVGPYTIALAPGSAPLPPGIALTDNGDGTADIDGPATTVGTYAGIVIRVTDTAGSIDDLAPFSIEVAPNPSHRYWQIYVRLSGSATFAGVTDIQMMETSGGANVIGGGTASINHPQDGAAANAFDGNTGNYCQQDPAIGAWFRYDFGAGNEKNINEIKIWPENVVPSRTPIEFDVMYSDTNVDAAFVTKWSCTRQAGWTAGVPITFTKPAATGAARRWRLRPTGLMNNGLTNFCCAEMQLRTAANGASVATGGTPIARSGTAADAFDANTATFYAATAGSSAAEWLGYDFGAGNDKAIVEFTMLPRQNSFWQQFPLAGYLESSPDGESWIKRWEFANIAINRTYVVALTLPSAAPDLGGGLHRYWGLRIVSTQSGGVFGCAEIEFRPTPAGADQTGSGTAISKKLFGDGTDGNHASLAFDNNLGEPGFGGGLQQEIIAYDFGPAGVAVEQVAFTARGGGATGSSPSALDVVYADSNGDWVAAWSEAPATWVGGETRLFTQP